MPLSLPRILYSFPNSCSSSDWNVTYSERSGLTTLFTYPETSPPSTPFFFFLKKKDWFICLPVVSDSLQPYELLCPWDSLGKNTEVGCHASSRGSFRPRDQTCIYYVSCISREILYYWHQLGSPSLSQFADWCLEQIHAPELIQFVGFQA